MFYLREIILNQIEKKKILNSKRSIVLENFFKMGFKRYKNIH